MEIEGRSKKPRLKGKEQPGSLLEKVRLVLNDG